MTKWKENCSKLLPPPAWIRALSFFVNALSRVFNRFIGCEPAVNINTVAELEWHFPARSPPPILNRYFALYFKAKKFQIFEHTYINKPALQLAHALSKPYVPYLFDLPPWALIKLLDLESWRLFETGAYLRLLLNFHHF